MTVYIVLFRGVGGATQLPTARLREELSSAGFENVATYINSGNAVVKTSLSRSTCQTAIAKLVKTRFGFEKDIMLANDAEWARAIEQNPFGEAVSVPTSLHLFRLAADPEPAAVRRLDQRLQPTERLRVDGSFMYFHAPDGFGKSRTPPLIDRLLGVATTARNWNTVLKLGEMAAAAR